MEDFVGLFFSEQGQADRFPSLPSCWAAATGRQIPEILGEELDEAADRSTHDMTQLATPGSAPVAVEELARLESFGRRRRHRHRQRPSDWPGP